LRAVNFKLLFFLKKKTLTYDETKKQWGLNVQHVKNNNKEEQLWFDQELSGLIAEWKNILESKNKKIKK
jgi:hypothetical protein